MATWGLFQTRSLRCTCCCRLPLRSPSIVFLLGLCAVCPCIATTITISTLSCLASRAALGFFCSWAATPVAGFFLLSPAAAAPVAGFFLLAHALAVLVAAITVVPVPITVATAIAVTAVAIVAIAVAAAVAVVLAIPVAATSISVVVPAVVPAVVLAGSIAPVVSALVTTIVLSVVPAIVTAVLLTATITAVIPSIVPGSIPPVITTIIPAIVPTVAAGIVPPVIPAVIPAIVLAVVPTVIPAVTIVAITVLAVVAIAIVAVTVLVVVAVVAPRALVRFVILALDMLTAVTLANSFVFVAATSAGAPIAMLGVFIIFLLVRLIRFFLLFALVAIRIIGTFGVRFAVYLCLATQSHFCDERLDQCLEQRNWCGLVKQLFEILFIGVVPLCKSGQELHRILIGALVFRDQFDEIGNHALGELHSVRLLAGLGLTLDQRLLRRPLSLPRLCLGARGVAPVIATVLLVILLLGLLLLVLLLGVGFLFFLLLVIDYGHLAGSILLEETLHCAEGRLEALLLLLLHRLHALCEAFRLLPHQGDNIVLEGNHEVGQRGHVQSRRRRAGLALGLRLRSGPGSRPRARRCRRRGFPTRLLALTRGRGSSATRGTTWGTAARKWGSGAGGRLCRRPSGRRRLRAWRLRRRGPGERVVGHGVTIRRA
mmetsp:Transcript_41384/g.118342  ORF Transcript_41384/g.118342 Transcript_41384/m.118342 type:complete len:656 (+) Transcript_41384:189-2156(+)